MRLTNLVFNLTIGAFTLLFGLFSFTAWHFAFGNIEASELSTPLIVATKPVVSVFPANVGSKEDSVMVAIKPPKSFRPANVSSKEDVAIEKTVEKVGNTDSELETTEKFYLSLDIEGYYYQTIENLPHQFKDFKSMEVWLGKFDEKTEEYNSTPPYGSIEFDKVYNYEKFHYAFGQLTLSTVKIRGVSYEFSGGYKKKTDPDYPTYEWPVLSGTLVKIKNGKIIAKAKVEFVSEEICRGGN